MAVAVEEVRFFRPRKPGPELLIEDAVVSRIREVFVHRDWPQWVGGSVPIGAGFPDVVSAWYEPQVVSLADFQTPDVHILAYLRSVRRASLDTIAQRLRVPAKKLVDRIASLQSSDVIFRPTRNAFSISPVWRHILPEVVTVEAKVADWQAALQQANRNRIFAHRSFVALPNGLAQRVMHEVGFELHGVGVLSVSEDGEVVVQRPARRNRPSVWNYYFHLAAITADDLRNRNGYCHSRSTSKTQQRSFRTTTSSNR